MNTATLINLLNMTALAAVMVSIGFKVSFGEVLASARRIRLVMFAVLGNFVAVPLVTVGLLWLLQAPSMAAAGFLILAVCPGAPVAPPFAAVARGDVSLATGLMVILAAVSAPLAPTLLTFLLAWLAPDSEIVIDYVAVARTLLVTQLFPLTIALGIHASAPRATERLARPVTLLANLLLLGVVGIILATQYETLQAFRLRGWIGMLVLLGSSLGIGWLCGGRDRRARNAIAVTTGVRNAAVGLVIVAANFAGTPAVTAVIAYALVSIFGTLGFAFILGRGAATR